MVDELHKQVKNRKHKPIMKEGHNENQDLVKWVAKFCDEEQSRDTELIYFDEK